MNLKTYTVFVNKRNEISIREEEGDRVTDLISIPVNKAEEVAAGLLIAVQEAQCPIE